MTSVLGDVTRLLDECRMGMQVAFSGGSMSQAHQGHAQLPSVVSDETRVLILDCSFFVLVQANS